MRRFQLAELERVGRGDIGDGDSEKAPVIEVSEDCARGLANTRLDEREIELVIEVLLERFWRDDIVIKVLAALLLGWALKIS